MKKLFSLLLACCMLFGMSSAFAAPAFTAGTYTVTVAGHNGNVTLDVTFSDSAITAITVGEHKETASISDAALTTLSQAIIDNQSLAVDTVSGATVTSNAVIAAVTEAVKLAGGDPAEMQTKVEKAVSTETVELTADVVVVGAGAAGMTSALNLAQKGYNVLLLEKMSFPGGATVTAGGGLAVCDTAELREMGEHTDPEVLFTYLGTNGDGMNDVELSRIYAYEVGDAVDFLRSAGVTINYANSSGHTNPAYARHAMAGGGSGFIATMNEIIAQYDNINLMLSTEAKKLTVDENGVVTGLTAVAADGTTYTVNAKAVVLATGTYSASAAIVGENFCEGTLNTAPVYLTGDGIMMATAVGAAVNHLEWVEVNPYGIPTAEFSGVSINNTASIISAGAIIVNQYGQRVMDEEAASTDKQIEVYKAQDNHAVYLVMNQAAFDTMREKGGTSAWGSVSYVPEDIDAWLAADSLYPIFVKGETAAEAAAAAGIDADALAATIAAYNDMAAAGVDTEFGRANMTSLEGTCYIVELRLRHAKTLGGLAANANLQMIRVDGTAIEGLYGAGELVSGAQGTTETGMLTWAVTSGYYVAEMIDAAIK